MRILLDYRPALRERTGVGEYVHRMASALLEQLAPDDTLVLFSSSLRDRLDGDVLAGASAIDLRIPVRVLNFAWHRLEWPPVDMLAGSVDVAHAAHPLMIPVRSGVRAITLYDLDFLDHPERTRAEIRRDYPQLAPDHARRADLVVTISLYTAAQASGPARSPRRSDRRLPARSAGHAASSGTASARPDTVRWHDRAAQESRCVVPRLRRVLSQRPDAPPLVLAGRTVEQSAAILAPLSAPPLAGHVRHLGYVTAEVHRRLLEEASMLVLPSLEEGFGIPAVEAMATGVPVVASRRGALPEVLGDAGSLVEPSDDGALAAAMEALLADATAAAGAG